MFNTVVIIRVLCMLDNEGYKHKLRMCGTNCFFHGNSGYANVPQFYKYIACLVSCEVQ